MLTRLAAVAAAAALVGGGFNGNAAWRLLVMQVRLGPRPAGSATEARLARRLRALLPHGRFEPVPGGLRNVVGVVPGRDPRRYVVVGAHFDTKQLPGFVGADDGASGVAVVTELARELRPRELRPTVYFVLFDGEEAPPGSSSFLAGGDRGSRVAAKAFRHAQAMILLDMIGDRNLSIPREASSDMQLWARLRAAARAVGTGRYFPPVTVPVIFDDTTPFEREHVPSIDLIDFTYPCWHRRCDDLAHVSEASLEVVGRTVLELLRTL
ncbi:MAG TPA: M28 family metallopeptidase [Gaiellaceae bacterium]|nr:M28 family metallopeptidase [Gaiellaceae bacterium]